MSQLIELIKVLILGIVEGVTEWLPISSTGHMLLIDEFLMLKESAEFKEMFFIVIQFGAILAVLLLFWNKMFPFQFKNKKESVIRKDVFSIWLKVVVACIPGAAVTLLFDDWFEANFHTPTVIAIALVFYGFAFLLVEKRNEAVSPRVGTIEEISYKDAFLIGLFQVLSIVPGTSRSGSTIIGSRIINVSRVAAAEFTFFMAVPVMLGYSLLKLLKFGFSFTAFQLIILLVGCISAFLTSVFVIRFFMDYIKKNSFAVFGVYRIVLGVFVLIYFWIF